MAGGQCAPVASGFSRPAYGHAQDHVRKALSRAGQTMAIAFKKPRPRRESSRRGRGLFKGSKGRRSRHSQAGSVTHLPPVGRNVHTEPLLAVWQSHSFGVRDSRPEAGSPEPPYPSRTLLARATAPRPATAAPHAAPTGLWSPVGGVAMAVVTATGAAGAASAAKFAV